MAFAQVVTPRASATLVLLAYLAALVPEVDAGSAYVAGLCRGGLCNDKRFPILDYDKETGSCICRAHPCWNDNGVEHSCSNPEFPSLQFAFSANGTLTCKCSKVHSYGSVHVSRDLCPGMTCNSQEAPVLDWDPQANQCRCRPHPCWDVNGTGHRCPDPNHPYLHYREETNEDGASKPICECTAIAKRPRPQAALDGSLRGTRKQQLRQESMACTWSAGPRKGRRSSSTWN